MFKIYGKADCTWCEKAKELILENGGKFEFLSIPEDISKFDVALKIGCPFLTVPQITYGAHYIGSFKQLEQMILKAKNILNLLRESEQLKFKYMKNNGEERITTGTLNQRLIPIKDVPTGGRKTQDNIWNIRYYDLEKMSWRSFNTWNWGGKQ